MLKKSHALLFLLLWCFGPLPAQKKVAPEWPGVTYSSAKIFLYNLDNQLHEHYHAWRNGVPNFTLVEPGTELRADQVKQLLTVLHGDTRVLNEGLAKCYEPHHAVFFYDTTGKIVAAFDVCFLCEGIKFYPAKQYKSEITKYTEALTKKAEQQLEEIKEVFVAAGVPVFKNENEVDNYRITMTENDTLRIINDSIFIPFQKNYKSVADIEKAIKDLSFTVDSNYIYVPNERIDGGPAVLEFSEYCTFSGTNIRLNIAKQGPYALYHITDFKFKEKTDFLPPFLSIGKTRMEVNKAYDEFIPGYSHQRTLLFNSKDGRKSLIVHFADKTIDQVSYYSRP